MADIVLINDQGQDQTLSGVSKLITRGPDGEIEFSLGGGGGGQAPDSVLHYAYIPKLDGKSAITFMGVTYKESPAVGVLYVDISKSLSVLDLQPIGCLSCTVVNSDTGNVLSLQSIEGYDFTTAELDEDTIRYSYTFSITWSGGTSLRVRTNYCRLAVNAAYAGVNVAEGEGKVVLSGINAANFISDSWSKEVETINVFDLRQGTDVAFPDSFRSLDALDTVYFPSGDITFPGSINAAFLSCPNIKLLDYSVSEAVQPCPPGIAATTSLPDEAVIKVPAALYDAWIAAANWSDFASHIVAV